MVLGGIAGLWLCRSAVPAWGEAIAAPVSRRVAFVSLAIFAVLLIGLPMLQGSVNAGRSKITAAQRREYPNGNKG